MKITKLLTGSLLALAVLAAPALSEAAHRYDNHPRSYGPARSYGHYSRSYVYRFRPTYRPVYVYDTRPYYSSAYYDPYYDYDYDYGYAPRTYVRTVPHYSARYHYHGRTRCYSTHGGIGLGIHLRIR
jgi:hypothetical protein